MKSLVANIRDNSTKGQLNTIRNKASHPTREPISEDEYNLVKSLSDWLK